MSNTKVNRRKFLTRTSAGVLGAGLLSAGASSAGLPVQNEEFPKIKAYRILGRTGFKVSDIGTGWPFSESVLKATLSCGVNFIETSEMYGRGNNEVLIGNVIKEFSRDELFIASKISHIVKEYESENDVIDRVKLSLERLQTDYIDCMMIHGAENSERVKNKHFHKAIDRLKKEGKVRFTGISCHGHSWFDNPEETFEQVLTTAIQDGRFDIIMLPYNYFQPEMAERVLKACHDNNLGTMIMKSVPMLIYEYFRDEKEKLEKEGKELSARYQIAYEKFKKQTEEAAANFAKYGIEGMERMKDGAIQFILSNENVSTICCGFVNFDDVKKYVRLSGTTLNAQTEEMLSSFRSGYNHAYCRIGCNLCEASCPHHLPVNTILRYNYYFQAKKQEKRAIQLYSDLAGSKPDICINCPGNCEIACPYGVLTKSLLAAAHRNMSFDTKGYA